MIALASGSKLSPKLDKDLTPTKTMNRTKRRRGIKIQIIRIICSARSYHNNPPKMVRVQVTRATAYQLYRWFRIVDSRAILHPSASPLLASKAIVMRRRISMGCLRTTFVIDLSRLWWRKRHIHVRTILSPSRHQRKTWQVFKPHQAIMAAVILYRMKCRVLQISLLS